MQTAAAWGVGVGLVFLVGRDGCAHACRDAMEARAAQEDGVAEAEERAAALEQQVAAAQAEVAAAKAQAEVAEAKVAADAARAKELEAAVQYGAMRTLGLACFVIWVVGDCVTPQVPLSCHAWPAGHCENWLLAHAWHDVWGLWDLVSMVLGWVDADIHQTDCGCM